MYLNFFNALRYFTVCILSEKHFCTEPYRGKALLFIFLISLCTLLFFLERVIIRYVVCHVDENECCRIFGAAGLFCFHFIVVGIIISCTGKFSPTKRNEAQTAAVREIDKSGSVVGRAGGTVPRARVSSPWKRWPKPFSGQ